MAKEVKTDFHSKINLQFMVSHCNFDFLNFLPFSISNISTLQNFCLIPEPANEKCLEGSLITGTEINFKFPLDDRSICTIDEMCLPPPPMPPSKLTTKTSSWYFEVQNSELLWKKKLIKKVKSFLATKMVNEESFRKKL